MSSSLTPRQLEVAQLIGFPDATIAVKLKISPRRVRQQITAIAKKWHLDPAQSYRTQIAERLAKAA